MLLITENHNFRYETENLCRLFFPAEELVIRNGCAADFENAPEPAAYTVLSEKNGTVILRAVFRQGEKRLDSVKTAPVNTDEKELEYLLALALYETLTSGTGYAPPWGMLTGVRPAKLLRTLTEEHGSEAAGEYFLSHLKVSPAKTALAAETEVAQKAVIGLSRRNSFSLYLSIPFCPTRCSYCSFVSHSIASAKKLIEPYVALLCRELELIAAISAENGLKPETVYIGGGTPTSLSAGQLQTLTDTLERCFGAENFREYTVEAGRPDTLTAEKLSVLKNAGVTRISVNPQSFSDEVLEAIGRRHTAAQTVEKFRLARSLGFDNINMDLIAGLPSDTPESFGNSVKTALDLAPENITVHTLALKRASRLQTGEEFRENQPDAAQTGEMLLSASSLLREAGYHPYYLYRQSKTVGNHENTGYSLPGYECLYNIFMMEEIHSVLAAGAGAVTKLKAPDFNYIERIFNHKYPYEYINRFEELVQRKQTVTEFYHKFG